MNRIRENMKKDLKPDWIPDHVWGQLCAMWNSEEYKTKQATAIANRASTKGGMKNRGGSIPTTEHKRRMIAQLGRQPTMVELFKRTHFNEKTGEFVDQRSADAYEHYLQLKSTRSSNQEGSSQETVVESTSESDLWLSAVGGKNKKGRIFGIGSEAPSIHAACSATTSTTSPHMGFHPEFETELQRRVDDLTEQNHRLASLLHEQQERLQQQKQDFDQRLEQQKHDIIDQLLSRIQHPGDNEACPHDEHNPPPV